MTPGRLHRAAHSSALLVLCAADLAALGTLRPSAALLTELAHPHRWVAAVGADAAAAGLAGAAVWLVACRIALGLAAAAARTLPGGFGRAADRLARIALPAALYRLVAGAAGLSIALTPLAASAAPSASTGEAWAPGASSHAARRPAAAAPAWPTAPASAPAPAWPVTGAPPAHQHAADPPAPRRTERGADHPVPHRTKPAADRIVVRPGDTLWQLAADRLREAGGTTVSPARVAAAWPRWFATNSRVIGADPNLLHPGEVLHPPLPHHPTEGHRP